MPDTTFDKMLIIDTMSDEMRMLDAYMDARRNGHGPHLPLRQVLEEWAAQSGESPEAVVAALWGAQLSRMISPWALKDCDGEWGRQVMAFIDWALASDREADRLDGWRTIDELTVSVDELRLYCRAMNVRPPPCLTRSDGRRAWLTNVRLAPPLRHPTKEERRRFEDLCAKWLAEREAAARDAGTKHGATELGPPAREQALAATHEETAAPTTIPYSSIGAISVARKAPALAELQGWYEERVRTCASDQPSPSREQDMRDAKLRFPGRQISRAQLFALRRELAPASWKAPGRKSGRK